MRRIKDDPTKVAGVSQNVLFEKDVNCGRQSYRRQQNKMIVAKRFDCGVFWLDLAGFKKMLFADVGGIPDNY